MISGAISSNITIYKREDKEKFSNIFQLGNCIRFYFKLSVRYYIVTTFIFAKKK